MHEVERGDRDPAFLPAVLQARLDSLLRPLLDGAPTIALVDFPAYGNVGDSAIWCGALDTLERLGVPAPVYTCDIRTYSRRTLGYRIGGGTILITGGGNLGDLWEWHQTFREQLLADFPENRIVQLSQSIHFDDHDRLERTREAFGRHKLLTLLLRDKDSHEFARREFTGAQAHLVPDMVFGLNMRRMRGLGPPTRDVLWLKRSDREDAWSGQAATLPHDLVDWSDDRGSPLLRLHDTVAPLLRWPARTRHSRIARTVLSSTYRRLALRRLDHGLALLAQARVVVTDRLHGHILCLLLGVPHVLLDNSYGKVTSFVRTWTEDSPLVHLASSPADAAEVATALLAHGPRPPSA